MVLIIQFNIFLQNYNVNFIYDLDLKNSYVSHFIFIPN